MNDINIDKSQPYLITLLNRIKHHNDTLDDNHNET
jgi:hypothetical protein